MPHLRVLFLLGTDAANEREMGISSRALHEKDLLTPRDNDSIMKERYEMLSKGRCTVPWQAGPLPGHLRYMYGAWSVLDQFNAITSEQCEEFQM